MFQFNRREFLYSSVAISAAVAAPQLLALASDEARQPANPVSHGTFWGPGAQHQLEDDNFMSWRQEGRRFGNGAIHYRESFR